MLFRRDLLQHTLADAPSPVVFDEVSFVPFLRPLRVLPSPRNRNLKLPAYLVRADWRWADRFSLQSCVSDGVRECSFRFLLGRVPSFRPSVSPTGESLFVGVPSLLKASMVVLLAMFTT